MQNSVSQSAIMGQTVQKTILWAIVLCLCLPALAAGVKPAVQSSPQTPEGLFSQIQGLLQKKDLPGYLDLFAPGLRSVEKDRLETFFNEFRMESVKLRLVGKRTGDEAGTRLYCQAYFQNAFSVMIESWQLTAAAKDGRWEIVGKETSGHVSNLYKIKIPAERAEHVRSVEILHRDIRLSFTGAAVFYDNIPGVDTAFLIIGKGTVRFSPSDRIEKHQMELLYKKPFLEDDIDYVYVRCSNEVAASNVRISRGDGEPAVTQLETDRAAALFARNYPRSFTIESSVDKEILSFLPQGDEAVFDFKGKRAGELTYVYYPFSDEQVTLYDRSNSRILSLYAPADEAEPQAKRFYISFAEKYDIDRYQLDLSYSPSDSYLSGKARISVVPRTEDLDALKFRFNTDLEILKIQDQEKRELFYTLDKLRKYLYVYLIGPPARQQSTWIEVYYRGRMSPPLPTTDVVGQAVSRDKLVFRPRFETYLFSQTGFWYPAPPEQDYFLVRLKLLIPPEYKCVAVGDLVEKGRWNEMGDVVEIEKSGSSVYTFETREPVKYMAFIVGKFEHPKDVQAPVPIQTYTSTEINENDPAIVEQAKSILEYYIRSFGPFPFEKLAIVRRLFPTAGGHSPASFIVLNVVPWRGDSPYPMTADNPVNLSDWDEYFLAHEIAHQWWGQGVSFDTYRDQWLSEGLAQFAAASYLRSRHGEKAYAVILKKFSLWTERKSVKGPIAFGSRLSFSDFAAYQAIIYDKAALAMFMLQDVLGPDVFFAGLKEFFGKYKYSAARTENFIAVMERVSGRDLKNFFQGWFRSYELPDVRTSWSEEIVASGARLKVRVTQTKGLFVFPLWIEWTSRGETRSAMAVIDRVDQEIVLEVPGKVDRVRFNPTRVVPGKFS
jgi:hypothetical protein